MLSTITSGFCKNESCPSSHDLLEFQNGDLPRSRSVDIRRHMASCEFCAAEVEFYSHYPQEDDVQETSVIPAPLFQLAEALLKYRHNDSSSLDALLKERIETGADTTVANGS